METKKRVKIDCREHPSSNCSVSIAGTEEEVLELGVRHAVTKHGEKEGPELQNMLKSMLKEEKAA